MKLQWPVNVTVGAYIIQPFGGHNRDYSPLLGHPGIDFYAPKGTPVYASCDGWLYQSINDDSGFGIHLSEWYEENGYQYIVTYGHFLKPVIPYQTKFFSKDVPIKRGQLIGYCDSTGFSNIDHVHIGLWQYKNGQLLNKDNGYNGAINFTNDLLPEGDFISFMGNAQFVHKTGTAEYGFYLPATNPESMKDKALNLGLQIVKPDGLVDFGQAKEIQGL